MFQCFWDGQPFVRVEREGFFKKVFDLWRHKVINFFEGLFLYFPEGLNVILGLFVLDEANVTWSPQNIEDDRSTLWATFTADLKRSGENH